MDLSWRDPPGDPIRPRLLKSTTRVARRNPTFNDGRARIPSGGGHTPFAAFPGCAARSGGGTAVPAAPAAEHRESGVRG
jgi:hypothetical protein